jgi:hypothetical protein
MGLVAGTVVEPLLSRAKKTQVDSRESYLCRVFCRRKLGTRDYCTAPQPTTLSEFSPLSWEAERAHCCVEALMEALLAFAAEHPSQVRK